MRVFFNHIVSQMHAERKRSPDTATGHGRKFPRRANSRRFRLPLPPMNDYDGVAKSANPLFHIRVSRGKGWLPSKMEKRVSP